MPPVVTLSGDRVPSQGSYVPEASSLGEKTEGDFFPARKITGERRASPTPSLDRQYAFYAEYHSNPVNVLIHLLFVWPILFSGFMLVARLSLPGAEKMSDTFFSAGEKEREYFLRFWNWGLPVAGLYAVYYPTLDWKAGSLGSALCMGCWFVATSLLYALGRPLAWKVATAMQVICWGGQFLGHAVFEKRAPALFDNLVQALLMAPIFVLLEALWHACGYEPYPGFTAKARAAAKERREGRTAAVEAKRDKKNK